MAKKEKKQPKSNIEPQFVSQSIAKKVRAQESRRKISVILIALLLVTLTVSGIIWAALQFIEYNSVQISVGDSSFGLIGLYNDANFTDNPNARLRKAGPVALGDATYSWLDIDSISAGSGTEGSETAEYIGFSFYVRNMSDETVNYISKITIPSETKRLADAVRIMVIVYDETDTEISKECYARAKLNDDLSYEMDKEGNLMPEKVVPWAHKQTQDLKPDDKFQDEDTKIFFEDQINGSITVMETSEENSSRIRTEGYHKYVVLMWLEGEDKETVDSRLGGKMAMSITLSALK